MVLAIDFDNTIHDTKNVISGYRMGQPTPGAVYFLKRLHDEGHKIIIFSHRAATLGEIKVIKDWLNYFAIPFDEVTPMKPRADYYIDDKAVHFSNWHQVADEIGVSYD